MRRKVALGFVLLPLLCVAVMGQATITRLFTGGVISNPLLAPDGSAASPSYSFTNDPNTGLYRVSADVLGVSYGGALRAQFGGNANVWGETLGFGGSAGTPTAYITSTADGVATLNDLNKSEGIRLQFAAIPSLTLSFGFGTGAAVGTGSTDTAGAVFVGSTTSSQGTVTFASTWSNAPYCTASIATQTAGSTRAIGAVASTTKLTLVPATAFAASTTAVWTCIGAK